MCHLVASWAAFAPRISGQSTETLLAKRKNDDGLQERLRDAANLNDAVKLANEEGGLEDSRLDFF